MDTDLVFILGLIIGVLSIPSMLSAYSEGRSPRVPAVVLVLAAGLVAYAVNQRPEGYDIADIPDVFMRVVSRYIW